MESLLGEKNRLAAARVINVALLLRRPVAQFTRPSAADDTSAATSAIAVTQVVPFAEKTGSGDSSMDAAGADVITLGVLPCPTAMGCTTVPDKVTLTASVQIGVPVVTI